MGNLDPDVIAFWANAVTLGSNDVGNDGLGVGAAGALDSCHGLTGLSVHGHSNHALHRRACVVLFLNGVLEPAQHCAFLEAQKSLASRSRSSEPLNENGDAQYEPRFTSRGSVGHSLPIAIARGPKRKTPAGI
jgi:hypothetical protein